MKKTPSPATRIIAAILILPCLYLGWLALQWGIADRNAYDAAQLLKSWQKIENFKREDLTKAIELTETAIRWAPDHPNYRDQLAELLLLQFRLTDDPTFAQAAKMHLVHSRSIRPRWGKNWASYAEAKHLLGEIDAEFAEAIRQAAANGPWEPIVIQTVVELGTAHYGALPDDVKPVVISKVRHAMNHQNARLPSRAAELIKSQAQGWTQDYADELINAMAEETWQPEADRAYVNLVLTLWPIIPANQQQVFIFKLAEALSRSRDNAIIRRVRDEGQLPLICPYLPRTQRFINFCSNGRLNPQ